MQLEWVHVPGGCVVANAEGSWLHEPVFGQPDPFVGAMSGGGSPATTGALMDGAIAAGLRAHPAPPPPPLDVDRWVWHLVSYYHLTTHTPGLMRDAAERFSAAGRPELAEWALEKAEDEHAHDRLALDDLSALGYDAEPLAQSIVPPIAAAMLGAFRAAVDDPLPLRVLAYAHVVERLALTLDRDHVESVRAILPTGVYAIRCLRVHSAIGSDAKHVAENVELMARLPAAERIEVALACCEIAALWSRHQSTDRANNKWLRATIGPYRKER